MVLPRPSKSSSGTAQAIQQLFGETFRVLPWDYVDAWNSNIQWLTLLPYENPEKLFNGDIWLPAMELPANGSIVPPDNLYLPFVKPIWLDWTLLHDGNLLSITQAQVTYIDGTNEILVWNAINVGPLDTFNAFAPPTKAMPIVAIEFTNTWPGARQIFEIIMLMQDTPVAVTVIGGGISPSTNQFYTDDVITPIPAGLVGVTAVFGFNSQAFIFKNNSAGIIEISEDAGLTWEQIEAGWAIAFDAKERANVVIRDPLGVGGLSYRIWVW